MDGTINIDAGSLSQAQTWIHSTEAPEIHCFATAWLLTGLQCTGKWAACK